MEEMYENENQFHQMHEESKIDPLAGYVKPCRPAGFILVAATCGPDVSLALPEWLYGSRSGNRGVLSREERMEAYEGFRGGGRLTGGASTGSMSG